MGQLPKVDGRTKRAKRQRVLFESYVADAGGWEATSEAQRARLSLIATMTVDLEQQQPEILAGCPSDRRRDLFGRGLNTIGRRLEKIGLGHAEKPDRDLPPSLRGI